MSAETLACRTCHHPLTSDAGCAVCLPIKPHLVVTSAVDEDSVPLAVVASEAVSVLRKQLTAVKNAQRGQSAPDPILAGEARAIAGVLAKLLDSARKVIQDGADAVESMTFQEKAALFLEWTKSLPGPYRRRLIDSLLTQGSPLVAQQEQHDQPITN